MATRIEARAVLSADDRASRTIDAIGRKLKDLGKAAKISGDVDRLTKALGSARDQMRTLEQFKGAQSGFIAARDRFRQAQAAVEGAARAMAQAERPTRALQSALNIAQRDVSRAAAAYERQKDAVLGAKRAIEGFGMPVGRIAAQQAKLRSVIDSTSAALARQEDRAERRANRRAAIGNVAAGAGILAASKGKELGFRAITSAASFDIAVRKQRVFTDISSADQGPLIAQAKRIGQETPFSNTDVVKAQTASMQGLPASFSPSQKAQVAQGITAAARNLALVMETTMADATETIRTYLQTSGKDISTGPRAVGEANTAVNQMVRAAKIGGMDIDDVRGFLKYGVGTGTAAGLSTDTLLSLGALARRGGLRGDEAGVFVRAAAGKLSSPTRGGLAALNAAGINYGDFQRAPGSMDVGRLESQFQNQLGTSFSPGVRAALATVLSNPEALKNQGAFTSAVTGAVAPDFGTRKGGGMRAIDKSKIARTAGQFYRLSSGGVNAEGLLDAIMRSGMGIAGLNELLTGKHGGKGAITSQQWGDFVASRQAIGAAGQDPDFAKKRADEIMGGLGGSLENLKGSFDNLITSVGTANDSILKLSFDKLGSAMDALSGLPNAALQAGSALVLLAGTAAGIAGALRLAGLFVPGAGAAAAGGAGLAGSAAAGGAGAAAASSGVRSAIGRGIGGIFTGARAAAGPFGLVTGLSGFLAETADAYGYRKPSGPGSGAFGRMLRGDGDMSRPAGQTGPVTVTGQVQGSAQVTHTLVLDASGFARRMDAMEVKLNGAIHSMGASNGPGSSGRSSPDASAGSAGSQ